MNISFHTINGLSFGIEYVARDEGEDGEEAIDETCIVVDLACFRIIIGMGDYKDE